MHEKSIIEKMEAGYRGCYSTRQTRLYDPVDKVEEARRYIQHTAHPIFYLYTVMAIGIVNRFCNDRFKSLIALQPSKGESHR